VHAELTRELIERQAFGVSHVRGRCRLSASEDVWRNGSQSAVPQSETCSGAPLNSSKLNATQRKMP